MRITHTELKGPYTRRGITWYVVLLCFGLPGHTAAGVHSIHMN